MHRRFILFAIYGLFGLLVGRIWYFHEQNRLLNAEMHRLYDKNRNMKLDAAEMISFLTDHGIELTHAQHRLWIQHVDDEKDGFDEGETHKVLSLFSELPTASASLKSVSDWSRWQIWVDVLLLGLTAFLFSLLVHESDIIIKTLKESSWYTKFKLSKLRRQGHDLVSKSKAISRKARSKMAENPDSLDQSELDALHVEKEDAKEQFGRWVKESQKYLEGALRLQSRIDPPPSSWWRPLNSDRNEFHTYGIYQERHVFGGIGGAGFFDLNREESYFANTCFPCENVQTGKKELVRIYNVGQDFDVIEAGGLIKSLNFRRTQLVHMNLKCYSQLIITKEAVFVLLNDFYDPAKPPSDLAFIIDARGFPLSEAEGRFVFLKVAAGLHQMHSKGIAHGFINLETVAIIGRYPHQYGNLARGVSDDFSSVDVNADMVAVIDTGEAEFYQCGLIRTQNILSDDFLAPEDIDEDQSEIRLTKERDQWRLGAVLYTALTGELPFSQDCFLDGQWRRSMDPARLAKGMLNPDQHRWNALSDTCRELISGLLRTVPGDRIDSEGVINHPWFSQAETPPTTSGSD